MPIKHIVEEYKQHMVRAVEFLQNELRSVRTGRASTGLVENLMVDYYENRPFFDELIDLMAVSITRFGKMEELLTLPGVGRKTANCVLGDAFGIPGITCDTHVIRLSRRLGLSENSDPVKLEFDLAEIVPKKNWTAFSHLVITHGRNICKARKPNCPECPIEKYCPSANNPDLW